MPTTLSQHSGGSATPVSGHSGVAGYTPVSGHDRQLAALLSLKPSLLWALDEASGGVAIDNSGNGRQGTLGPGNAQAQGGDVAGGEGSTYFANVGSGLVTSAYSPFVVGSKRTFMGWANGGGADNDTFFGGSGAVPGAPQLVLRSTGQIDFLAGTAVLVSWVSAWTFGVWNPWALTYDDSTRTAELFINGSSKGALVLSAGNGFSGSGGTFQAGAVGAGVDPWNGWQQDVCVFERILSASEIAGAAALGAGATAVSAHGGPGYTEVKAH